MSLFDSNKKITDYTKQEFVQLLHDMFEPEAFGLNDREAEEHEDNFVKYFRKITEHPNGSDLLFYPDDCGIEDSDEAVADEVEKWRQSQGLPCFKDE